MADVKYCLDVLGQQPTKNARMARFLVIVNDDSTATLRSLWLDVGEPVFIDRPLTRMEKQYIDWFFFTESGEVESVTPQGCACGAGVIAYTPMSPGDNLILVRTPDWLS
jgi:hypothetical protein